MHLTQFKALGLRNLSDTNLSFSSELNIIEGKNAAGKSSLLEGVGFLVSGRSFRTSKNIQIISHNQKATSLFGEFNDLTKIGVGVDQSKNSRKIKLNGETIDVLSKVTSIFPVQILSPESYHLIDSGPNQRRKFLDWLLFHVEHSYKSEWKNFNKTLKQRNSYLRSLKGLPSKLDNLQIESWDTKFIDASNQINMRRALLSQSISKELELVLNKLTLDLPDKLSIEYSSGIGSDDLKLKLSDNLMKDISRGMTTYGPHKADIRIMVGNKDVKDVLSRGQKKMLINALYLSQTTLLKKLTNKDSLFIIDDFSSELDCENQLQLVLALKQQSNVQVLLSCLDSEVLKPLIKEYNNVNMFHVEHGEISKTTFSN